MLQRDSLPAGVVPAGAVVLPFGGCHESGEHAVPEEIAVNITYATMPFAVMMMTPADLEDFAYGFSLTEGVIGTPSDIRSIKLDREERGIRLLVDLSPSRLHAHLARR